MTLKLTGHAEIDRQHALLVELVGRLEHACVAARPVSCHECDDRPVCVGSLTRLTADMLSFLTGHVTYEERLMDLLPAVARCQAHVRGHKDAHADISQRLREVADVMGEEHPREVSTQLHRIVTDWMGSHTSQFDASLALQLQGLGEAEIEFDTELVAILDEYVFHNRPGGPSVPRVRHALRERAHPEVKARLGSLTPRQHQVCRLVAQGMANKEIAKKLGTTVNTIKTHRAEIFRKMEVSSVLELARALDALLP